MEREEERRRGKGERLFFFSLDKKGRGKRNFLSPPRMGEGTVYGEEMASQKREMEHITSKGGGASCNAALLPVRECHPRMNISYAIR